MLGWHGAVMLASGQHRRRRAHSSSIELSQLEIDEDSFSPSGLSRTSLLTILVISGAVFLLLHVASDHTAQSQRFAARPEFSVWAWAYVAYGAAATAVGFSTFPSYQLLSRTVGRRATAWSVVFWVVTATLLLSLNPGILSAQSPLWLQTERVTTANLICGVFAIPSVAGLFLVNVRLSTLRREMRSTVTGGRAGTVIGQLLWLRATLQRFLVSLNTRKRIDTARLASRSR